MFLALDVSPPAVFEVEFSHDQEQDPRALHTERLVRVDSFLERPSTPEVQKSRSWCRVLSGLHLPLHTPRWPPPPLCSPRQCSTMSVSGRLCPQTPGSGRPTLAHLAAARGACMRVHMWGGGTPAGMPLLALSLLYLIPVICSWSSVPLRKEPWPEPAMLTAQPPPLLTLDPPAPIRPHSPSGQLPAEGKTQVPMAIFSIWLAPESPSPPMPPRSSS